MGSEKTTWVSEIYTRVYFNCELMNQIGGCSDRSSFITGLDINSVEFLIGNFLA